MAEYFYPPSVSLPPGLATEPKQDDIINELKKISGGGGKDVLVTLFNDYGTTNIDDTNWTQISPDIGANPISLIHIFDSSGYTLEIGVGASGSEVRKFLISPGGLSSFIHALLPANSRLSVRALNKDSITSGTLVMNLMGAV